MRFPIMIYTSCENVGLKSFLCYTTTFPQPQCLSQLRLSVNIILLYIIIVTMILSKRCEFLYLRVQHALVKSKYNSFPTLIFILYFSLIKKKSYALILGFVILSCNIPTLHCKCGIENCLNISQTLL